MIRRMCGIAGFVRFDRALEPGRDGPLLQRMASVLVHRGPDDEQLRIRGNVGFAFRRLSIVDLAGGEQPMESPDGALMQMTNGEIYNHADLRSSPLADEAVRGSSDCAVILPLYRKFGLEYLRQLNGIFATALLDTRRKRLLLARDRLGVKPLYYYRSKNLLVFGSEVKAVLAHPEVPRRFDWKSALVGVVPLRPRLGADRGLVSYFEEIVHVPGGHAIEVDLATGDLVERPYWDPVEEAARIATGRTERQPYIDRYRELLSDSVRLQLMADVEYGLFLSGGIDSVTIARLASERGSFHTFTVLGQSTMTNGDAPSAHLAAKELGLENHQVFYDWRKPPWTASDWRHIVWRCEMPNTDAGMLYKQSLHGFAKQCRPDLKVMLLGEGSDELNGGYSTEVSGSLQGEAGTWQSFAHVLRDAELRAHLSDARGANRFAEMSTVDEARSGQRAHLGPIALDFWAREAGYAKFAHPFEAYWNAYLSSMQMTQLWREDRNASAHGIENRVPFLDHRIVEHLMSVPPALHEDLFWDKRILRDAMRGKVSDTLRERKKVPFFDGEDRRYTNRLVYQLLCADGRALLEEAFVGAAQSGVVLDKDVFMRLFDDVPNDPEYASVPALTELVNMGLLASMARDPVNQARPGDGQVRIAEVKIDDWDAWRKEAGVELVKSERALDLGTVVAFADDILVVRCENGDPGWMDRGAYYILREDKLLFMVDPELEGWIRFLNAVDGERSIGAILGDDGIPQEAIWKHLEEAFEHDVLRPAAAPLG
jgi:asparagine synthase (glutamine-hydrolysing)